MKPLNLYFSYVAILTIGTFIGMFLYKIDINREMTGFISINSPIITILSLSLGFCLPIWWKEFKNKKEIFMNKQRIKYFFSLFFRIWLLGSVTKLILMLTCIPMDNVTSLYAINVAAIFMFVFLGYQDRKEIR